MKNRYIVLTLSSLFLLIVSIQIYAINEPGRMESAAENVRTIYVSEGAGLYVDYCAECHGSSGEGSDMMPRLNRPALADADTRILFQVIARAAHGTSMAAWHEEEGGTLNDYQIGAIVALLQANQWDTVKVLADIAPQSPQRYFANETSILYLSSSNPADPHDCVACHEEPAIHADRFGLNCANCHVLAAWKPALLTRHTFLMDHGDEGNQPCLTCHTTSYVEYTCFQCHDHEPDHMQEVHLTEGLQEFSLCADCHPTGIPNEAGDILAGQ